MVSKDGFTLIELLIVISIISLGLFILTPRLTKGLIEREDSTVSQLNKVLDEALESARKSKEPVKITFILGSSNFIYQDRRIQLHNGLVLEEAYVNEYPVRSLEVSVRVYPEGICDYFYFRFSGGKRVISMPLLCRVKLG